MYFKGRNFCGKKLSRFRKTAKYLHFAGINFRGWSLMKHFAGINFRGEPISKDFTGIKKGEILNLWEETFVFIVLWLRWGTWPVLKSLEKRFSKNLFSTYFFLEFLIFWNFTNATIIWYWLQKRIFFRIFADDDFFRKFCGKKLSRMTSFEKFCGNKLSRIWLRDGLHIVANFWLFWRV